MSKKKLLEQLKILNAVYNYAPLYPIISELELEIKQAEYTHRPRGSMGIYRDHGGEYEAQRCLLCNKIIMKKVE